MAAHSKLAGPVRVTKTAKRPINKDKSVVSKQSDYVTKHAGKHEILDEFSRPIVTRAGTVVKPARRFGNKAAECIMECMKVQYGGHASRLPSLLRGSREACANQFFADKGMALAKAMDCRDFADDSEFAKYVAASIARWFNGLYAKFGDGPRQDALRKRLERDADTRKKQNLPARFRTVGKGRGTRWGLVGGSEEHSTVDSAELQLIAQGYPIDIDYKTFGSYGRQRDLTCGKPGQLENMIEGVLKYAQGTLPLSELNRILLRRVPALKAPEAISMSTTDNGSDIITEIDLPDKNSLTPEQLYEESEDPTRSRALVEIVARLSSSTPKERAEALTHIQSMLTGKTDSEARRAVLADPQAVFQRMFGVSLD